MPADEDNDLCKGNHNKAPRQKKCRILKKNLEENLGDFVRKLDYSEDFKIVWRKVANVSSKIW